jgi:hypothetical protein
MYIENMNETISRNVNALEPNKDSQLINKKIYNSANMGYTIMNYTKDFLCFDDYETSKYRSVIFSNPQNKLLCYSPPKSIKYDIFMEDYPTIDNNIYVNEIIEGVMINLFYDERIQSWEVATKGSIGGNYKHKKGDITELHNKKTFIELFMDALQCMSNIKPFSKRLNKNKVIEIFPKEYCYNFVLQHPENKILLKIETPKLYLVGVYKIAENVAIKIPQPVFENWDIFLNIHGIIHFPKEIYENSYDKIIAKYCSMYTNYINPGVMITNLENGERTKILNPVYVNRRKKNNQNPNMQYQYLCLNRIDKTEDFLKYYPVCKNQFKKLKTEYLDFIYNIHRSYILKYIEGSNTEISPKYLLHVDRLHNTIYLPSLCRKTQNITKDIVKQYVENMEPDKLLFYLNYNNRQYV